MAATAKLFTSTVNDRLFVQAPSVIETVISEEPVAPEVAVTLIVRLVPLPPMTRLVLGTSAGLDELASTCKDAPALLPRLPKLKLTGPLDPPGARLRSANGEICPAEALSAISNELLPVNVRSGAICSTLVVPLVISSMWSFVKHT